MPDSKQRNLHRWPARVKAADEPGHNRPLKAKSGPPVVYLRPAKVDFYSFNEEYLRKLQAGDSATVSHFFSYFSPLLMSKLRYRRIPTHIAQDIMQDTFMQTLEKIKNNEVREPEHLGAFVNGVCRNKLYEYYRETPSQCAEDEELEIIDHRVDLDHTVLVQEIRIKVKKVMARMPERDRRILHDNFFLERDKDELCREYGVDRDYLRVLLHRALRAFRPLWEDLG